MVQDRVDSTVDNGTWFTLAEAGRALGVSEKTVRRRVKAGQVQGRQIPTQRGPAWQVWLPTTVDNEVRVDSTVPRTDDQARTMLELVRLVGDLQTKAEAAAMWQARAELLAERLTAAEDRLAIAAPVQTPVAPQPEPAPAPAPVEPPVPLWRRRWLLVLVLVAIMMLISLLTWPR